MKQQHPWLRGLTASEDPLPFARERNQRLKGFRMLRLIKAGLAVAGFSVDAELLFDNFDVDGDGMMDVEELVSRCLLNR